MDSDKNVLFNLKKVFSENFVCLFIGDDLKEINKLDVIKSP